MPSYAPHSPAIVGSEWPGARQRVLPIGPGNAAGARFTATASESVPTITTLTRTPAGPQPLLLCDVYDLANDVNPADELCLAKPTDCYSLDTGFQTWVGGVFGAASDPAVTACVDDIVGDNDPNTTGQNDALVASAHPFAAKAMFHNTTGTFFHGTDGSAGASITGKRIKYVEVIAIMSNQTPSPITVCGYLQGTATVGAIGAEASAPQTIPANTSLVRMRFRFKQNNTVGGLPWDHTNIAPYLNGTGGFGVGVLSKPGVGWFGIAVVEFGVHVCTEARVAHGVSFGTPGQDAFSSFTMQNPQTGATAAWAKVSGHTYFVAFTALRASSAIVGVSTYGVPNPKLIQLPTTQLTSVALGSDGVGVPTSGLIPDIDAMHCLLTVGGGYSVDSNAYAGVAAVECGAGSTTHRQDMTGSGTFATCGILVSGDGTQDADLTIQLKRGASVLATATVALTDQDCPADGRPTLVKRALSAGVAFSGGEYLQVSSSSARPWLLPCLYTRGVGMTSGNATAVAAAARGIGGTADSADTDQTADFPWFVATIPSPPSGLTAVKANFTTTNAAPGGPARISYAALDWTSTGLGGSFGHYEVLRNGNVIAAITSEAASFFNDFELKRGLANSYTVRVVRDDGAVSNVSAAAVLTVDSPNGCDVILASNVNPALTLAYQTAPGHAYGRPSSGLVTPQIIAGRQAPFAIRPLLEGNSDVFSHTYTVQMSTPTGTQPTTIDRAVFAPLVRLVELAAPYVAVLQGNGDRWFASGKIDPGSMVFAQPGNAHRATVAWTEVSIFPAVVETDAPWSP